MPRTRPLPRFRVFNREWDPRTTGDDVRVLGATVCEDGAIAIVELVSGPSADDVYNGPALLCAHVEPEHAGAARAAIESATGRPLDVLGADEDADILDATAALDAAGVPYAYEVSQAVEDAPDLPEPDRTKLLRFVE